MFWTRIQTTTLKSTTDRPYLDRNESTRQLCSHSHDHLITAYLTSPALLGNDVHWADSAKSLQYRACVDNVTVMIPVIYNINSLPDQERDID